MSSVAVESSADGAKGRAYVQAVQVAGTSLRLVTFGCYLDRFVLDDGRWLIAVYHHEPFTGDDHVAP